MSGPFPTPFPVQDEEVDTESTESGGASAGSPLGTRLSHPASQKGRGTKGINTLNLLKVFRMPVTHGMGKTRRHPRFDPGRATGPSSLISCNDGMTATPRLRRFAAALGFPKDLADFRHNVTHGTLGDAGTARKYAFQVLHAR